MTSTVDSSIAYVGDPHGVLSACRDLIFAAEESVVLQMYLFAQNGDQTLLLPRARAFPYAATVASWLVEKKRQRPSLPVVVVLDSNTPANPRLTRRGGVLVRDLLRRAGVAVLDANLFVTRFDARRRLHPAMNLHLHPERAPLEDWVEHQNRWQFLHNVEDHRKNLVIDGGRAGAVTSHNFFDPAFDWHENLYWLTGEPARALSRAAKGSLEDALRIPQSLDAAARASVDAVLRAPERGAEVALAPTSAPVPGFPLPPPRAAQLGHGVTTLLQSEAIRPRLDALFSGAAQGAELAVATTYFSDLPALAALIAAAERGASVRVLIDSVHALPLPSGYAWLTRSLVNHDVLRRTTGRAVRAAVQSGRFELRVHDSGAGAMMHLKTAARFGPDARLVGGQANFTPNSFSGAWLETNIETTAPAVLAGFRAHFDELWSREASRPPRAPSWADNALRSGLLRLFDAVGLRP